MIWGPSNGRRRSCYWTLAITILGLIPLYVDLLNRYFANRRIDFELERYYDTSKGHPLSDFHAIRVLHPSKPIDHGKVFVGRTQLAYLGRDFTEPDLERKIPVGGGETLIVPDDVFDLKVVVMVMDGDKVLRKKLLGDIPDMGLQ